MGIISIENLEELAKQGNGNARVWVGTKIL